MKKFTLPNGLTVIIESRKADSVSVEVSINVGSNHEPKGVEGICHFLEHMVFNGSVKRPSALELTNTLEKLGGLLNGGTSNEQTSFYVKAPAKHFNIVVDVLSDMLLNPLLKKEDVEKERRVVLNEIQLYTDDPKLHIWTLLQKELYKKHPSGKPVYGKKEAIKKISREELLEFHKSNYVARNMAVTIVGGVDEKKALNTVKEFFGSLNTGIAVKENRIKEPRQVKKRIHRERRKILQSYLVLACNTVPRGHKDSYILDVIHAILGRRSSGRMFDEVRNKRGLAYEVSVQNENFKSFGFMSVYIIADKKNLSKVVSIIESEFKKLQNLTSKDLREAKTFLEGDYLLENEDTLKRTELLSFFDHASDVKDAGNYLSNIQKVTLSDVKKVARKYLNSKYTLVVVQER